MISLGFSLSPGASRNPAAGAGNPSAPAPAWRNIIAAYGPGNDNGQLSNGSAGTVTATDTYVNESGGAVGEIKAVLTGWAVQLNAADLVCPNAYDATVEIEYPVGAGFETLAAMTVPPGDTVVSPAMAPATPIAAGASFRIRTTAVLTGGQKVPLARDGIDARFRVAGILAEHSRVNLIALGDSIVTNNSQPSRAAAAGICPVCQIAIIGSTGYQNAPEIARRVALAAALGVTHAVCNFQANDHSIGRSLAQLQNMATTIADAFAAEGIATVWATGTPNASAVSRTGSGVTTGGVTTIALGEAGAAAKFAVGEIYELAGTGVAASRKGFKQVTAVDTGANTVAFFDPLSADGTEPNTMTVRATHGYLEHQSPAGNFAGGASSTWALFNAWLKVHPGEIVDHIALDEAMAVSVSDPRWDDAPAGGYLRASKTGLTVSAINSGAIFTFAGDGETYPANWCTGGRVLWLTGARAGQVQSPSNSTSARAIYVDTADVAVGDTFAVIPAPYTHGQSTDGLHPAASYGQLGGVAKMRAVYAAKYEELAR